MRMEEDIYSIQSERYYVNKQDWMERCYTHRQVVRNILLTWTLPTVNKLITRTKINTHELNQGTKKKKYITNYCIYI